MGRAGGAGGGGGRAGGGHSFGGGRSGGGRSSFSSGRNSSSSGSSGSRLGSSVGRKLRGSNSSGGFFGSTRRSRVNNVNDNSTYDNRRFYNNGCATTGCGCLSIIFAIIMAICTLGFVMILTFVKSENVTTSTIEREPLPKGSVNETEYYTDNLGWIGNKTELEKGMKNFYIATGVQPYLYITDNVYGEHITDVNELAAFAESLYQELFTDEAHILLVFYEYNGDYADYYLSGSQAKTVIDREAGDILLDYIDKYYYNDNMTDDEFFSTVFDKTASRIMTVEKLQWPILWSILVILIIVLVLIIFIKIRATQKIKKAEQDARILETPLEQ
jgi:uncharacterized membrane protein